ncbi:MAG: DEAD/DEAH box helicase family protein [Pirellulales bacterium]|nr:DEAD/DEAH box helicase family protein [Pirellulales bacterium]
MLELRNYQQRSLDVLESYFRLATQHGANMAFYHQTDNRYRAVPQLPELPYICLRIPTGGGKTLMACHALSIAAKEFLQAERAVCLWLVPSNTIREQTLAALRNRQHPYRQAIDLLFGGQVSVMDLQEAINVTRGTLTGDTCIIVSTLAALRVEDTDGRKVYETCGYLMDHFSGLVAEQEALLEKGEEGVIPYSLCNVLRLHRPLVIMDEAHNARTQLSFDTLARFNPSSIIEFTATPETEHKPDKGLFASNILHHVSAAELKAEDMVKLPIKFEIRTEWKEVVAETLKTRRTLEAIANEEEKQTGEYIRPIVLFQAQPKNQNKEPITAEVLRQSLIDDFKIPEAQIAIATGQTRQIEDVDLFARDCEIRFIITVAALKEGWDCSFAYILCSVAEIGSARAVEQILGRVLRLPGAVRKQHDELNCAYALSASRRFSDTAMSLKDALIQNGFQKLEAELFVKGEEAQPTFFGAGTLFFEADQVVSEKPDLSQLPKELREKVAFDQKTSTISVKKVLTEQDKAALEKCFTTPEAKQAVEILYHASHGRKTETKPVEREPFRVPMLSIRVDGQLELFEEGHFLDNRWKLSECEAGLTESEFPSQYVGGESGELDVNKQGNIEVQFVDQIHRQLRLLGIEPGWDIAGLTNWLDRQLLPHDDLTRTEAMLFIHRLLSQLMESRGVTIEQLAAQKFRLKTAIAAKIDNHRQIAANDSYQKALFSADAEIEVGPEVCFEYSLDRYSANYYYEGPYQFRKHYFPLIGELKDGGKEGEDKCAIFLDQLDAVKYWVRNLERRPEASFWLQTSTDKFYPDFVALLKDGRYLVVESKGEDRWSNDDSKEKRAVGELWADRSKGACLFVMPKGPDWEAVSTAILRKSDG